VVPAPPVTASASPTQVCTGTSFDLHSSTSVTLQTINLLSEGFNGATNTWTLGNGSTGGTIASRASTAWTLRGDGYTNFGRTFHSNDNSQFYLSSSYDHTGVTSTTLTSPVIDTRNYTTLSLDFHHYYNDNGVTGESAYVQVSTDNAAWATVATYNSDQGSSTGFVNPVINLDSYVGNATF